jgi:RNA polymerase sigma-70 factor (ECF subfamily)
MATYDSLFIGGHWVRPANTDLLEVRSPRFNEPHAAPAEETAELLSCGERKPWRDPRRTERCRRRGHPNEVERDSELLRALHDEHAHALWSFVVGLTNRDRGRAQDVVQETLLRAWCNPAVLERTGGSGRSWLLTVAKRIVVDEWRSASRRPEVVTDHVPEQTVEDTAEQIVDRQLVLTALRTLSTEHRQVLLECYFRGASVAEAAETLGLAPGTIKSRTHYALHALRQAIDEMGGVA